jgi:hypothetical protein
MYAIKTVLRLFLFTAEKKQEKTAAKKSFYPCATQAYLFEQ